MPKKHPFPAWVWCHLDEISAGAAFIAILVACAGTPTPTQVPLTPTATQAPSSTPTAMQAPPPPTINQVPTETATAQTVAPSGKMESPLTPATFCKSCHSDIYDEWKQSYHSKTMAGIIGVFATYMNYVKDKKGDVRTSDLLGCLGCHAPAMRFASEKDLQRLATLAANGQGDELTDIGVDCVACHTLAASGKPWERPNDKQLVVYGPIKDPVEAKDPATGTLAHTSAYSEKMDKSEMCATCHTYVKPADIQVEGDWNIVCTLTYDAWSVASTGKAAGKECQNCHMPAKDGNAVQWSGGPMPQRSVSSHLFPGWHSNALLSQSVNLAMSSHVDGNNLIVTVTVNNNAGHRMPDA